jgi:hypothetical protein
VTSSPAGISCGSTCSHAYTSGTQVTLTAAAASGSTFAGWSGACSGTGTCTVTMSAARSATATFNAVATPRYTLAVSKTGGGSGTVSSSPAGISCGSTCSHSYTSGTEVTLTAAAASGSTFAGWSGACSGTGTCSVSLTAAKTVTATFNKKPVVKKCVVPKVTGKALKKAKHALKTHGCRVGKIKHARSKRVKKGHVISQKPKPHKHLKHGAKVKLVGSKGKH